MNYKDLPTETLLKELLPGWQPAHSGAAQELVRRLGACLKATTEVKEIGDNIVSFVAEFEGMYLRDMDQVSCFVLSGIEADLNTMRPVLRKAAEQFALVVVLSDPLLAKVREEFAHLRFLLLSADQVKKLLKDSDPRRLFREILWQQVSKRRMIPYNILFPATGNMFFGRSRELDRLRDENQTSFAIAGPGRIGKTSIIKRYHEMLTRTKDPMGPLTFFINFIDCSDHSPDGVARFFAAKIEATKWSNRMTADQLVNFLLYQHNKLGGPLNLLLDEVDELCEGEAFNALVSAAKAKYCRLVICGRGVLLKSMLNSKSPLQNRLELVQLEPLDDGSATELLLRPLTDLGFKFASEELVDQVLRLTGRLPHLLQIYGKGLANLAIEEGTDTIYPSLIETLKWDSLVANYFVNPLFDLKDPLVRVVGFTLLRRTGEDFSIPAVQRIAAQAGFDLDHVRAREICNDLLINNVLVWRHGTFRVANEGLYFYAKEMGFFESALHEALGQLSASA